MVGYIRIVFGLPYNYKPDLSLKMIKSHSSQAVRLAQCQLRDSSGVALQNQTRSL